MRFSEMSCDTCLLSAQAIWPHRKRSPQAVLPLNHGINKDDEFIARSFLIVGKSYPQMEQSAFGRKEVVARTA